MCVCACACVIVSACVIVYACAWAYAGLVCAHACQCVCALCVCVCVCGGGGAVSECTASNVCRGGGGGGGGARLEEDQYGQHTQTGPASRHVESNHTLLGAAGPGPVSGESKPARCSVATRTNQSHLPDL